MGLRGPVGFVAIQGPLGRSPPPAGRSSVGFDVGRGYGAVIASPDIERSGLCRLTAGT
jgi:hypothetical protein